jgi:DNA polymerase-3 subunit alpha
MENFREFPCGCRFRIKENGKFDFKIKSAPMNCPSVWKMLGQGLTKGIFQLESNLGKHWCKELKPESIEHLTALASILRPGALQAYDDKGINTTQHYCLRKNGAETVTPFHKSLKEILEPTYQLNIYQEGSMEICKKVAGFNLQEADEMRKAAAKKLPALMAEVRVKFIQGCNKVGILTSEEANNLFDQIEKSQRYSFCRAHAFSYGLDGYLSAYTKAHFPLHFFKSYLKFSHEKQKPLQEIRELVNEAKLMDIQVLGPSILHLKKNFWQDGERIYFGLSDVKKVGDKEVFKIQNLAKDCKEITGRNLQDFSFYHFLLFLSDYIRSEALENWIKVGAFSYINKSRNTMLAEYNAWNSLTDGEKKFMRNNCNLFTELIPALHKTSPKKCDGGGAHNVNRSSLIQSAAKLLENPPTSLDDSPNWIATQEEKLLGIALTCSRIDACDTSDVNTTCKEFNLGQSRQDCIFAVEVKNVKELVTKRGKNPGKAMAQLTVEDHSGSLQMTAFPNVWEEYSGLLTEENTVVIMGYKDKKTGGAIINKVFQI